MLSVGLFDAVWLPDQASRNQFDTWLQLQGEARRGERIDLFGKPETDLRARLQR